MEETAKEYFRKVYRKRYAKPDQKQKIIEANKKSRQKMINDPERYQLFLKKKAEYMKMYRAKKRAEAKAKAEAEVQEGV